MTYRGETGSRCVSLAREGLGNRVAFENCAQNYHLNSQPPLALCTESARFGTSWPVPPTQGQDGGRRRATGASFFIRLSSRAIARAVYAAAAGRLLREVKGPDQAGTSTRWQEKFGMGFLSEGVDVGLLSLPTCDWDPPSAESGHGFGMSLWQTSAEPSPSASR